MAGSPDDADQEIERLEAEIAGLKERCIVMQTPGVCGGEPCVGQTRIPVHQIIDYLSEGSTLDKICSDFPSLNRAHVKAISEFTADLKESDEDIAVMQAEIAELKKQIAYGEKREAVLFASSQDVNYLVDEYRKEIAELKNLVTRMRVAAVGDAKGPIQGVVEDIETLRFQNDELKKQLDEANRNFERLGKQFLKQEKQA